MKEVTYKVNVETKGAVKEVDELNDSIKDTGKDAKSTQNSLNTITGGAVGRFNALKTNVLGAVKSFKSLRVAIIASGIGALVLAVVALGQAFTRSEAGQNKFAKLMGVIGSVVNNVLDLLADFGEAVISVFENPKQAIKDFANLIKENIINRFQGIMELIPALGKAVSLLFKGEFKEAGKVATNATAKVVLGVDNVIEKTQEAINKTKEFVKELEEEGKVAAQIADDRAKADKIERKNTVERAKADREIADLRFKAEQRDKFSVTERIKFLEEASALEEEITNQEIEAARLRFEAKKLENSLSKSTKEDLDEQAQLEAQLIQLNTSKLRLQKRLQTSLTTFRNEEKAERKAAQKANEEETNKTKDLILLKQEELKVIQNTAAKTRDELAARNEKVQAIQNEIKELQNLRTAKFAIEKIDFDSLPKLQKREAQKIEVITSSEEQVNRYVRKVNDNYTSYFRNESEKRKQIILQENAARLDITSNVLSSVENLTRAFGERNEENAKKAFNVQKALGIAQVGINTASAIMKVAAETTDPTPVQAFRVGNMIAMGVAGAAQIAAIAMQKFQPSGGTASTTTPSVDTSGAATSPTQPPSFNVVGQSGFNQVAGALSGQQPVQAFVVSGDVTTAQQLQNNTITQATF